MAAKTDLRPNESGATLLEFAVVMPILMLLCISIMDLARFLTIQALLNKGAEDGLNLAMKMPNLDVDIRGLSATDPNYQVFREARRRVLWAAARLPTSTLVSNFDQPSTAQLETWTITDRGMAGTPETFNRGVVLLRPGDQADLDLNGTTVTVQHPTVKPGAGGDPPPQSPEMLMKKNPVTIQLNARVTMYLPIFGTMIARGTATGFRENVPTGPLPPADPADVEAVEGLAFAAVTTAPVTTVSSTTTTFASCQPNWDRCVSFTAQGSPVCGSGACCPRDVLDPANPPDCQCRPCPVLSGG